MNIYATRKPWTRFGPGVPATRRPVQLARDPHPRRGTGCRSWPGLPTPYTLHPTPYTLHPTPYTLHPSPCTLHPTPYTLHPTPHMSSPLSSPFLLSSLELSDTQVVCDHLLARSSRASDFI